MALKIVLDLDGVCYPWNDAVRRAMAEHRGLPDVQPALYWNHLKDQLPAEEWQWIWRGPGVNIVFGYNDMHYPGAPKAMRVCGAVGDLHFITHRPRSAAPATAMWVANQRCSFTALHITGSHVAKSTVVPDADVYVDDKPEIIDDYHQNTRGHIFCPKRDWNGEVAEKYLGDPRVTVYTDIREVTRWVRAADI